MDINRDNYIIWITDFYDGTLNDIEKEALLKFLELNKDLKEEFSSFGEITLHPDISRRLSNRESLKKSISDIDDELSKEEIEVLTSEYGDKDLFINSASLKLRPEDISYPYKNKLKRIPRRARIVKIGTRSLAAAAGIAILISLILFLPANNTPEQVYLASRIMPFNKPLSPERDGLTAILSDQRISPRAISIKTRKASTLLTGSTAIATPEVKREEINISPASFSDVVLLASAENIELPSLIEIEEQDVPIDYPDLSPRQFLALNFRKLIMKEDEENTGKIKAYEVADAGINGLNKLLGWEMQFEKVTDEEGRLKAYTFTSQLINIDRKTKIADD